MLRRIILLALTCAMLFSSGCTCLFNPPYIDAPLIISDNSGGAIAVYEVLKGEDARDLYAQRIGPQGDLLWGEKGVLFGSGYERESGSFDPRMVSDSHGGTIIAWEAFPAQPDWNLPYEEWKVHRVTPILRLDSQGNLLWEKKNKPIHSMISDGSGGVIIASISEGQKLNMVKVDSEGNYRWGEDGVSLYFGEYSSSLRMVGDGSGGAIIVQQDLTETETNFQVFVQKVNADGSSAWGQKGILLYPPWGNAEGVEIVNDGSGGAIVAWQMNAEEDIHVQRVDANGNVLWQQNGKPLDISKNGGHSPHRVQAIADGEGGAIITWEEVAETGLSIYAQKIDADGNTKWQLRGVQVFQFDVIQSYFVSVTGDDAGGAIIVWWLQGRKEHKDGALRAQRLDADGKAMWQTNGVPVSTGVKGHSTPAAISQDGLGGVLIAWGFGRNMNNAEKPYAQRIDSRGNLLWGEKGLRLHP